MAKYERGFLGNIRIRGSAVAIEWDEFRLAEFARCATDPLYFFRNYVYIKDVDREDLVLFKPRFYQEDMLDKMLTNRNVIVKLPRQCGKTTLTAAVLLWHLIFHRNFSILIAAHKGDKARDVLNNVKEMYETLPEFLQHGVVSWNKGSIQLETGSRARATATSGSAARGDVYNMVYLDEFAFVAKHVADEFVKSVIPTVSSGKTTKIFITSTPKGLNLFYDMWEAAVSGKSGYAHVEIKWNDVPGRDDEFRKSIVSQFGQDYFDQEYGAEFLGSSRTLLSGSRLVSMSQHLRRPVEQGDTVRVYHRAEKGRTYACTVDVSEGLGADFSAIMVFDITVLPYTVAAVYKSNQIHPIALPGVIHEMASKYNDALVLVEANFGQQVGEILYNDFEYENMVFTTKGKNGPHAKTDRISGGFSGRSRVGLAWTNQSKRIGCTNLKALIESDQLLVPCAWIYDELKRFVVSGKSYAGEDGHDDLAMCMVLFAWMCDQGYVRDSTDVNLRGMVKEMNSRMIEDDMVPIFGTVYHDESDDGPVAIDFEDVKFPILIPDVDTSEGAPWNKLFDKASSRGGLSEAQMHDKFMMDLFNTEASSET